MIKRQPPPKPQLRLGRYQHYKGDLYEVIDVVCHSETLEWLVLYRPLHSDGAKPNCWVRPYEMFVEAVVFDGRQQPRFRFLEPLDDSRK